MTDRYALLLAAYATRDKYILMIAGLALILIASDIALASAKERIILRSLLFAAWILSIVLSLFVKG